MTETAVTQVFMAVYAPGYLFLLGCFLAGGVAMALYKLLNQ